MQPIVVPRAPGVAELTRPGTAEGLDENVVNLWRALDVLLEDGRVTKEHGTPNRNNRWFYRAAGQAQALTW